MSKILLKGDTGFENLTHIYTLSDPNTKNIRYVGKTDYPKKRLNEHIKKAKYTKTHKNNWILYLKNMGQKPILEIIDIVPNNDWGFWEEYWIDLIKSWGYSLVNIVSGGRGGNLGYSVNNKISKKLKNRKFSNETIQKMRIGAKNRKLSEEGRKSLSSKRRGKGNPMYGRVRSESSKKYRKVIQLDDENNIIKIWDGIIIASKNLNINRCTISDVCNNRKITAGGYKWKYYNGDR